MNQSGPQPVEPQPAESQPAESPLAESPLAEMRPAEERPDGSGRRSRWWIVAAVGVAVVAVGGVATVAVRNRAPAETEAGDLPVARLGAVRAAAVALAAGPYRVDFVFTWKDPELSTTRTVRWAGTLRSTGGDTPQWTSTSEALLRNEDGSERRLDAVTIVDDGRTRYFDTLDTTFGGLEWAAVTGSTRANSYWRRTADPVRVPEVDPLAYLDITAASRIDVADVPGSDSLRYLFPGLDPGLRLGARTEQAVEPFCNRSSPLRGKDFKLDLDVDAVGRPVALIVRPRDRLATDPILQLTVRDAGGPVTVDVPKPGTFAEITK